MPKSIEPPIFSVILPVHNGGTYVRACIKSVLEQRVTAFRLDILENSSTDGTREYVEGLSDSRVSIWPSQKKLSIEENWQRILQIPRSEYMTIIGHDDLLDPSFLEVILSLIHDHPDASLYQTHFQLIDSTGKLLRHCTPIPSMEKAHEFLAARLCQMRDSFGTGYVVRSRDYDEVGGIPPYHKLLFADEALWYMITRKSYKVASPQVCTSYRLHSGGMTGGANPSDYVLALRHYLGLLESLPPDADTKRVLKNYLAGYVRYYVPNGLTHALALDDTLFSSVCESAQAIYASPLADLSADDVKRTLILKSHAFLRGFWKSARFLIQILKSCLPYSLVLLIQKRLAKSLSRRL